MNKISRLVLLMLSTSLVLSGCAGAPTRFYTLDTAAPAETYGEYDGPPLRLDAVHIPADLDRPELVRESAGDRFMVSDNDHWAAPIGDLLQRVITQDLAARLPNGKVVFPGAPKPVGTTAIIVTILDFSQSDGVAILDVSWTLMPTQSGTEAAPPTPAATPITTRLSTPARGGGVGQNAPELSRLSDQLAQAITDALRHPRL